MLHEKLDRPGNRQFYSSRPGDPRFRSVDRLNCPRDAGTLCITYIGLYEELAPFYDFIRKQMGAGLNVYFMADRYIKNHYFLEFAHPQANKKDALIIGAV